MADAEQPTGKNSKSTGAATYLLLVVVGLAAGGGGFALPYFISTSQPRPGNVEQAPQMPQPKLESSQPEFVSFGALVVNLQEERLTRYLRADLTLQVDVSQKKAVEEAVSSKKAILKSWLIGYLSDKSLNDVRGTAGVNRLRREIQDRFNTILFPDGYDRIQDVLFQEFNVQ